ncbi:O-methyltransferase family protein [Calothrix sp. NIES-4071]|nr:O-methyltransferase family protein [Calothrix sp. NIES-4071]
MLRYHKLITLEADPKHAAVARANIERAGLIDKVDVRWGQHWIL